VLFAGLQRISRAGTEYNENKLNDLRSTVFDDTLSAWQQKVTYCEILAMVTLSSAWPLQTHLSALNYCFESG